MKIVGKSILYFAALIFAGGFITLFWEEVPGEIIKHRILSTTHTGNSGMTAKGVATRGGATMLTSIKYRYSVNGVNYSGYSIRFSGGDALLQKSSTYFRPVAVKVYHSSTFHFLSVIDRGIQIFIVILLSVLGFGLIEIHKWAAAETECNI